MNKGIKIVFAFILLVIFVYAFSNSYTSHSIDNLAYVIALGIDTSDNDKLNVTFQFTNTSSYSDSGGSSDDSSSIIDSVEASSVDVAINFMNTYLGKEINLAHCKAVVFSEEVAKLGIESEVYSLINNTQLRPTANIIVSKCDAKYYVENSTSSFEKTITKYYDIFPKSSKYTGYTSNTTIGGFFNRIYDNNSSVTAILGGTNSESTTSNTGSENSEGTTSNTSSESSNANLGVESSEDTANNTSASSKGEFDILANNSPISGERNTENIGLAVFNQGTLVGELNAIETLCHTVLQSEVETFLISIPSPTDKSKTLDLSVSLDKAPKINVDTSSSSPTISVSLNFKARILTVEKDTNFLDECFLNDVSISANSYFESIMLDYLYRTSNELNADVDYFYKYAKSNFLTSQTWDAYNWEENFSKAIFAVEANTDVQSSLLLDKS